MLKGTRKPKKLTAKQLEAENARLQLETAYIKLEIRERTANMLTQMQVFEGIFKSVLESAATVGEARRWYADWTQDINGLPIDAEDHSERVTAIIEKHGFDIRINDHHTEVDNLWEQSRHAH